MRREVVCVSTLFLNNAMTTPLSAEQKARADSLADKKDLETQLPYKLWLGDAGKKWLCRRLARNAVNAPSNPATSLDSMMERVKTAIARASTLITEWRNDFSSPPSANLLDVSAEERSDARARALAQIVTCAMAIQPELVNGDNAVFKRIVAQRLRIWERVRFDLNPKGDQRAFRYPRSETPDDPGEDPRLTLAAYEFWDSILVNTWALKESGRNSPADAIATLFRIESRDFCNLVYCQHGAAAVLMDSLLTPEVLQHYDLTGLARRERYFYLESPYNGPVSPHFLNDTSSNGRFEQTHVPVTDLQIGDHVFAKNSKYYDTLQPTGLWNGEHCFVTSRFGEVSGLKPATSEDEEAAQETLLEGLGVDRFDDEAQAESPPRFIYRPMTVYNIRNHFLGILNKTLKLVRSKLIARWWANGGSNGADPGASQVFDYWDLLAGFDSRSSPMYLHLRRGLQTERGLPPTQRLAAWDIAFFDGSSHSFFVVNPASAASSGIVFEWRGNEGEPFDVLPNDLTVDAVWGAQHPLMVQSDVTGLGGDVAVVRPR